MRKLLLVLAAVAAFASASAETVKLRAIEFRSVAISGPGPDGKPVSVDLRYSDMLRQILLSPSPNGSSADDVMRTVEVWTPIKRAIEAKEQRVLLNAADYDFVLTKLNAFRWSPMPEAAEAVAGFIAYLRGIKEQEFNAQAIAPPK
jgi:hypothetical protein